MGETMKEKPFLSLPVGLLEVNCYLVPSPGKKTLYIIDPGGDPEEIALLAAPYEEYEKVILLTHAHIDHIAGCGKCAKLLQAKALYIHPDDEDFYKSKENALLPYLPPAEDLPEAAPWPPEDPAFTIIHTPGHTPGGVCYYFKEYNALFSGDTLFRGSVGRTDLPGGNMDSLMRSIKEKLLILPDDLQVCPGHGYATSIGLEKRENPFL